MGTPRPSISPLSTMNESTKNSPSLQRNLITSGMIVEHETGTMAFNDEEKDDSSLLSEPDDDQEEEIMRGVHTNHSTTRKDDIDSEAETERLEFTPKHTRTALDIIGRTPSKLSKVEQQEDDLSEPPSPIAHDAGAGSSTSTLANGGKKRKRSDTLGSSLSSEASVDGDSPRKRANSFRAVVHSREETTEVTEATSDGRGKSRGRKGRSRRGGHHTVEQARETVEAPDEDIIEPDVEVEEEEIVDNQVEEDPVQKSQATDAFALLTKQFTAFREALISERLASIDAELALLEQPQCQHPEYNRMVACVQQRRIKQDGETRAYYKYRQNATQHRILAERAQIHSQYFQTVREIREVALDSLGAAYYGIQRERRHGSIDDNSRVYRYVDKRGDLLRQQAKYNREVSILSGVAKYVGFPAAPDINGISGETLDDDLQAMKLARPVHNAQIQRHSQPYRSHNSTPHLVNPYLPRQHEVMVTAERTAHDKFIEQHAWARAPQVKHTSLTSTPNISHTSDWAEPGFRKTNVIHTHDQADRNTPIGTPLTGRPQISRPIHESSEQANREHTQTGSSPLQVPKQRLNGQESNGWRNYSGTSTIDAPLGESNKETDDYASEHTSSIKRDFAQPDSRVAMPPMQSPLQPYERLPATATIFPERAEAFRTAGFRPLEGSYLPSAASRSG